MTKKKKWLIGICGVLAPLALYAATYVVTGKNLAETVTEQTRITIINQFNAPDQQIEGYVYTEGNLEKIRLKQVVKTFTGGEKMGQSVVLKSTLEEIVDVISWDENPSFQASL